MVSLSRHWDSAGVQTNCMHRSPPFYRRDLSMHGFSYLRGIHPPQILLHFGGVKSHTQVFFTSWGSAPLTPVLFKGQPAYFQKTLFSLNLLAL